MSLEIAKKVLKTELEARLRQPAYAKASAGSGFGGQALEGLS